MKRFLAESAHAQYVEYQHAVIGGDGAPAFGHDGGMRHFGFVADILDVIHNVVRVFLQRVVHAGFEIGLRAVVIDAQAAANVEIFQPGARAFQLHINARAPPSPRALICRMLVIWLPRWKCSSSRQSSMPAAFICSSACRASLTVSPNLER